MKEKKKKKKKEEPLKKEAPPQKDLFNFCPGCTPDICKTPCSKDNNYNLPF